MAEVTRKQLASNRKQNVACDACRAKKTRCGRESIQEIVSNGTSILGFGSEGVDGGE